MAKRQRRRPAQTSDPDAGVMTETHTGVKRDEMLNAGSRPETAAVDDRARRTASSPSEVNPQGEVTYDDIAALAYDLWVRRGHAHGSDFDDWLEAERQLREARRG